MAIGTSHLPIPASPPAPSQCAICTAQIEKYLTNTTLCLEWLAHIPPTLPTVHPKPRRLFRVQHSAALDRCGNEVYPGSETQDSTALGMNSGRIWPDERLELRICRGNVEKALERGGGVETGLIALDGRVKAANDYKKYRAMGCENIYVAHITIKHFIRGVITINMRPHGSTRDIPVRLPVIGTSSPRLVIFPAVAVMDIFQIQTKTCVKDLWFACDAIEPKHIVRRAAFKLPADWRGYGGLTRLGINLECLQMQHRRSVEDRGVLGEPPLLVATGSSFPCSSRDGPQIARSADDGESPEKEIPGQKGDEMEIEGEEGPIGRT